MLSKILIAGMMLLSLCNAQTAIAESKTVKKQWNTAVKPGKNSDLKTFNDYMYDPQLEEARREAGGQTRNAIALCSRVIARLPKDAAAYFVRSRAYSSLDMPERAIADFETGMKIDPNQGDALDYDQAIAAYCSVKNLKKAIQTADKAIELYPGNTQLIRTRGSLHEMDHDLVKAMQDYNTAIERGMGEGFSLYELYIARSRLYGEMNQWDKALEECNRAIKIHPDNPRGYGTRAQVYTKLGKTQLAAQDHARADSFNTIPLP